MIWILFLVTMFLNSQSLGAVVVQIEVTSRRKGWTCVQSPSLWVDHLPHLQGSQHIPAVQVQNSSKPISTDSQSLLIL